MARRLRTRVERLDDDDAISLKSSDIQRLVLCWVMTRKSRRCLRVMKLRLSTINPPALRMMSTGGYGTRHGEA